MSRKRRWYIRKTYLGDGAYEVSTIGSGPLVPVPETIIFDQTGGWPGVGRYLEPHAEGSTAGDLDRLHEDVVRRFACGEIALVEQV